jgi:hypothetical protein
VHTGTNDRANREGQAKMRRFRLQPIDTILPRGIPGGGVDDRDLKGSARRWHWPATEWRDRSVGRSSASIARRQQIVSHTTSSREIGNPSRISLRAQKDFRRTRAF